MYKWDRESYKMCIVPINMEVHTKCSSSHTQKSPIPYPLFTPLLVINIDKNKSTGLVLVLHRLCVWNWELYGLLWMHMHRKFSYSHIQNMLQPHHQSTKFRNMIVYIKIKVLIKFGTSGTLCELKSYEMCTDRCECVYMDNSLVHTYTEVTNTISTPYTTLA